MTSPSSPTLLPQGEKGVKKPPTSFENRPCYLTEAARALPLLSQLTGYPCENQVAAYK